MGLGELLVGHGGRGDRGALITRARTYEVVSRIVFAGRERWFTELVRLSGAQPGDRVLDVGSGSGYLAGLAARAVTPGGSVLGVDASEPMVRYAAENTDATTCRFEVGLAQELPCADGEFDVVLSSLMLHHLPYDQRVPALQEMRRVLRPGGRLLLADFRPPRSGLGRRVIGALSARSMRDNPVSQIADQVRDAGFTVDAEGDVGRWLHYVSATGGPARVSGSPKRP